MISPLRPIRILQVVGGLNIGGTETWLLNVLRHLDLGRYQMDFLVHSTEPQAYEAEIRGRHCRILACPSHKRPWKYGRQLEHLLHQYGPYDIVHSHVHHFTGVVLRAARRVQVPMRIAHSHSDTSQLQRKAGPLRGIYYHLMARWIRQNATLGLAASQKAAAALFGENWATEGNFRVLPCGVDLTPFHDLPEAGEVRAEWGIPRDAFVVGHVGNFGPPKNHAFLVEIARELVRRAPETRLLCIGDGDLRPAIQEKVTQAGLEGQVCFAGRRADVPRLLAAMDVFVFPSLWEGMPLSLIEAQAAGLRCFVSDVIAAEAHVVKPLIVPLSLTQTASAWAERILIARQTRAPLSRAEALSQLGQSPFSIESSLCTWKPFTMTVNSGKRIYSADRSAIVLFQGLVFLVTLLMLFGLWPEDQYADVLIRPLCILFSLHFVWCFWSWYFVTGRWLDGYTIFLLSLGLFNGGHFLLETFDLNRSGILGEAFSSETVYHTLLLVNAAVVGYHLGGLLDALRKQKDVVRGQAPPGYRPTVHFSPERARFIGLLFLLASLPATVSILRSSLELVATGGYMSLYQQEIQVGAENWRAVLGTFFIPGLLITFAMFHDSLRWVGACWVLMLGYTAANMLLGSRAAAMLACAPLAVLHHTLVRKIRPAYVVAACLGVLALFPWIAANRNVALQDRYSILEHPLTDNPFVAALSEMGGSASAVAHTTELFPSSRGYDYGVGYFYAVLTAMPNLFWDRHPSAEWGYYANWLVWTVEPKTARLGGGLGFSVIAEAYANFSIFGPPAVLLLLGFLVAAVSAWGQAAASPFPAAIEAVFLSAILVLPRAEVILIFRPVVWFCVLPCIFAWNSRGFYETHHRSPLLQRA